MLERLEHNLGLVLIFLIAIAGAYFIGKLGGGGPPSADAILDADLTVSSTCIVSLNTSSINFQSLAPLATSSEHNVAVTNNGNANQQVLVNGTAWSGAGTITVNYTKYDDTTGTYASKTSLTDAPVELWAVQEPADTNSTYWQVQIPSGQVAGAYTEDIEVTNSC